MLAPARLPVRFSTDEVVSESSVFETTNLILQPNAQGREYKTGAGRSLTSVKFGQLKLLVSEISFLTLYWEPSQFPSPLCIYVGAAPGNHTKILADFFPQINFHLYDTQAFSRDLNTCPNVRIFQQYFRDEDVKAYQGIPGVFFISDIRSLQYPQGASYRPSLAVEEIAWGDMRMQERWVKELRPVWSLLKFRLPYNFPFVQEKVGPTWRYLSGTIYFQPWTGKESAEARLVVPQAWSEQDYDYAQYEKMMSYHNTVTRSEKVFRTRLLQTKSILGAEAGYSNDYDSIATITVLQLYLEKTGVRVTSEHIEKLLTYIANNASGNPQRTLRSLRTGAPEPEDD